jgi:hypothetical protein
MAKSIKVAADRSATPFIGRAAIFTWPPRARLARLTLGRFSSPSHFSTTSTQRGSSFSDFGLRNCSNFATLTHLMEGDGRYENTNGASGRARSSVEISPLAKTQDAHRLLMNNELRSFVELVAEQ